MRKKSVVLYPGLGAGHLMPMIELAKVFSQHGVAATVALVKPPHGLEALDFPAVVARAAASNPSISFHVLPPPPPAATAAPAGSSSISDDDDRKKQKKPHYVLQMVDCLKAMNAPLRDFLRSSLPAVDALVIDMFCPDALDVAADLALPVYYSYASCAGDLAVFLNLAFNPHVYTASLDAAARDSDDATVVSLPGAPPFKASDLPRVPDGGGGHEAALAVFRTVQRMVASDGILVNTFVELETRAVRALRDGLCVPAGRATPPVYCVGPLVSSSGGGGEEHECLRWLDAQPDRSVVFLCFGSMGTFSERQLAEVAVGLERSEQRFLWVVRVPDPDPNLDLGAVLPDGFLERTKSRGLVVRRWVPQVDVLRHRAAGAFVTHCGWNSALEGVAAGGLPLLCWPLYAEQKMNKVFVVQEMELGVEMSGYDGGGEVAVAAEEVEAKVRWVMESEGGRALRERATAAKDTAAKAIQEGGSSHADFVRFLHDLDHISSSRS